jgi:hypothetical protein
MLSSESLGFNIINCNWSCFLPNCLTILKLNDGKSLLLSGIEIFG